MTSTESAARSIVLRILCVALGAALVGVSLTGAIWIQRHATDSRAGRLPVYLLLPLLPRLHPYFTSTDLARRRTILWDSCAAWLIGWSGPIVAFAWLRLGHFGVIMALLLLSGPFLGVFSCLSAAAIDEVVRDVRSRRGRRRSLTS